MRPPKLGSLCRMDGMTTGGLFGTGVAHGSPLWPKEISVHDYVEELKNSHSGRTPRCLRKLRVPNEIHPDRIAIRLLFLFVISYSVFTNN